MVKAGIKYELSDDMVLSQFFLLEKLSRIQLFTYVSFLRDGIGQDDNLRR